MDNKLVSIIIPMYNAENTIARCITSIQQQTYEEIEIIIINDGSTDESAQIVQNKAKQDRRIHVFTQKNQGVSEARNKGVEYATGAFIQFVDADDWIHKTMTAQLIAKMDTETDLTICGYQTAQKNIRPQQANHYEAKTLRQHIGNLYEQMLLQSPCNKLYRRSHILKHLITFPSEYSIGEDFLFNLAYLTETRNVALLPSAPYVYCDTEVSLTNKYEPQLLTIQKELHGAWETFLIKNNCHTRENQRAGQHMFIHGAAFSINNLYHAPALSTTTRYNALKNIVHDPTVQAAAKTTSGWIARMLRYKQTLLLHLMYTSKQIINDWRKRHGEK